MPFEIIIPVGFMCFIIGVLLGFKRQTKGLSKNSNNG